MYGSADLTLLANKADVIIILYPKYNKNGYGEYVKKTTTPSG